MRTTGLNPDIRTLPPHEIWVGIIGAERPYAAIATRLDGYDAPVSSAALARRRRPGWLPSSSVSRQN